MHHPIPHDECLTRLDAHIEAYTVEMADMQARMARHEYHLFGDPQRGIEGMVQRGLRLDVMMQANQLMLTISVGVSIAALMGIIALIIMTMRQ